MPLQVSMNDIKTVIKAGVDSVTNLEELRKFLLRTAFKLAMNPDAVVPQEEPKQEIVVEERHRFPGAGISMFGAG